MRAALYARVSTERQADRGTIGSQLALLREHIAAAGDELVGEYVDDGHSGARLDRPGLDALRDAAEAGLVATGVVPVAGPARPRLRLPGAGARRAGPLRRRRGVHRLPGAGRRRPASHPAHPGAGRDRRIRESQDRRTLPARQTVSGPRRRDRHLEGFLRLPPHPPQRRHRPSTPRGLRARGRGGAADLHRPRRRHHRARDLSPAQRRRDTVTDRQTHLGPLHALPAAAQRGLHRPGLLQPHRIGARPPPHPPHPAGLARPRRMDPDRLPPHRLRRAVRRPPAESPPTTPSGARAAPNPAPGCSKDLSNAVFAVSAPTATRCAAATAPGTATTTAATTTRSAPAANPAAVPNATSAPTRSMRSCSTTSAPRSPTPTSCWPANKPSP